MFAVPAYQALRLTKFVGKPESWQPCRVVGIDASGEEPKNLIEIRNADGTFYLDRVDLIRKPAPTA